jgi:carboxylesterase type B
MTSSVAAAGLTKLPVMVWIHGGSYTMCSNKGDFPGFSNTASGTFVRRGVVCVSLNYRVAAHGFLHVPDAGITNLALRDLICGLEWVQASIAAFGGNRDCVTLVGQSAGGIAIANLLGCPKAKGLFHRAIVQSAGTSIWEGSMYADVVFGDYKAAARPFLDANKRDADDWSIEAWQSLTSEQLCAVGQQLDHAKPLAKKHGALYSPPVFNSLIDDDLFEGKHPIEHIRAGCSRDVDLLVGATYCEASLLWAIIPKVPVVHQALAGLFGLLVPKMVLPLAIRGVGCSITQNTDDLMPHGALKRAAAQLRDGMGVIARERLRESTGGASGPGIISSSWAGTGESDGIMQALSYVFGCGGLASTALVQAHAEFKPPHVYELKLTDAESPKARNAHMLDLPLLFTMDDAAERAWLAGAFWGRREGRGEGMDALATGMQDCWAQFCKSGTPGDFNGMTW